MPALSNPTALSVGEPGTVRPETSQVPVAVASQYTWTVVHSGFNAEGAEDSNPVLLGINEGSALAGPGNDTVVLPAGMAYTFPEGTYRINFRVLAGAPLVSLLSSKGIR